ncbi:alpha-D-ribose 1-methylphosphonate 5-triphosphate synthase subunit PhnI [Paenibacillus phyllosphaerae]|uniref:Alpha-D-ribose 1-methylphosphonate 5-triphosphate synthase subunit PhnI n=1 Tax=Paenibacillus phyllosphaerae TaxID=274593 RepID=A0A7W5ATN3_9BACL|nr:hypothetical protein [Paenibacillus phyllosphaerae]MBB3108473.1 alpha-D-ribose 1-methylphosphonate 5-triphosphate synthase subunit PhnI [Paenibacillus phyllosphaerae]
MLFFESEYRRQAMAILKRDRSLASQELSEDLKRSKQTLFSLRQRISTISAPFFGPTNRPSP